MADRSNQTLSYVSIFRVVLPCASTYVHVVFWTGLGWGPKHFVWPKLSWWFQWMPEATTSQKDNDSLSSILGDNRVPQFVCISRVFFPPIDITLHLLTLHFTSQSWNPFALVKTSVFITTAQILAGSYHYCPIMKMFHLFVGLFLALLPLINPGADLPSHLRVA